MLAIAKTRKALFFQSFPVWGAVAFSIGMFGSVAALKMNETGSSSSAPVASDTRQQTNDESSADDEDKQSAKEESAVSPEWAPAVVPQQQTQPANWSEQSERSNPQSSDQSEQSKAESSIVPEKSTQPSSEPVTETPVESTPEEDTDGTEPLEPVETIVEDVVNPLVNL